MPFWTYMLHCADRTFYVGHTDDLALRLAQHEQGALGGYTRNRRPLKLVWSNEFPTRYEALGAERQIKGWSRAKKLALIREDWCRISALAASMGKREASTGSARTGAGNEPSRFSIRPELVEGHSFLLSLLPHLSAEAAVQRVQVQVHRRWDVLHLDYRLDPADNVLLPIAALSERTGDLWQHTCFEAFIRAGERNDYVEINLSPSTQWAAYAFTGYRSGMTNLPIPAPVIEVDHAGRLALRAEVDLGIVLPADQPWQLNLSAVLEEKSGAKSYWALAHPPEAPPDFHHPACFVLELPPAPRA